MQNSEVMWAEIEIMEVKLVVLFAHRCPKCSMMMPVVEEAEKFYKGKLEVLRIDIEKEPEIAREYGVQIVPTFVIIKEGQEIGRMSGMIDEKSFTERIGKGISNG